MADNLPAHPEAEHFEIVNRVISKYAKNTSVAQIAREEGVTQYQVKKYIEEWKHSAVGSEFLKERVDELYVLMDEHFSTLIQEAWKTLAQVDEAIEGEEGITAAILGARTTAVKAIADIEAKRVETLQKAGLLDAAEMGDELAEMEGKQQQIIQILKDVSLQCDHCKFEIAKRLGQITGQAIPVHE